MANRTQALTPVTNGLGQAMILSPVRWPGQRAPDEVMLTPGDNGILVAGPRRTSAGDAAGSLRGGHRHRKGFPPREHPERRAGPGRPGPGALACAGDDPMSAFQLGGRCTAFLGRHGLAETSIIGAALAAAFAASPAVSAAQPATLTGASPSAGTAAAFGKLRPECGAAWHRRRDGTGVGFRLAPSRPLPNSARALLPGGGRRGAQRIRHDARGWLDRRRTRRRPAHLAGSARICRSERKQIV